nr:hypothetical protein BHI3_04600 [Bacteriovorax sp. HI3]
MKFLLLLSLFFSFNVFASGCMPDDVQLVSEEIVTGLGSFEAYGRCEDGKCGLSVSNSVKNEWHYLHQISGQPNAIAQKTIELKIYDQYFVSSCSETHRYILGVDIDGKRFREEKDLDYL